MAQAPLPDPINDLGLSKAQSAHMMAVYRHHKVDAFRWVDTSLDAELPLTEQRFYKMGENAEKHPHNSNWRAGRVIKELVDLGLMEASSKSRVMFWKSTAWVVRLTARGVMVAKMMGEQPKATS